MSKLENVRERMVDAIGRLSGDIADGKGAANLANAVQVMVYALQEIDYAISRERKDGDYAEKRDVSNSSQEKP